MPNRLSPHRSWISTALLAAGLLVGCIDDEAATSVGVAAGGTLAQGAPIAPSPHTLTSPLPSGALVFATPGPASPPASPPPPSPSPEFVSSFPPGSTAATPASSPGDGFRRTNVPTDLAISGPAFFVYATRPTPESLTDLLFSRDGQLEVAKDTSAETALFRLRYAPGAPDGFFLVGFSRAGAPSGAPEELPLAPDTALISVWNGSPITAAGLALDADRNAEAKSQLRIDFTGKLSLSDGDLRAPDGSRLGAYVALASFEAPEHLEALPGYSGMYRYRDAAGSVQLGVAVSGSGRPLGNANLLKPNTLAQPTPSPSP